MPRLELIFRHSANGGGCFRRRDEDSTYLQSEPDAHPEYVGLKGDVVEVVILQTSGRSPLQIQQSSIGKCQRPFSSHPFEQMGSLTVAMVAEVADVSIEFLRAVLP
jgi:hypothetical protein